jgi:hypothetical protein
MELLEYCASSDYRIRDHVFDGGGCVIDNGHGIGRGFFGGGDIGGDGTGMGDVSGEGAGVGYGAPYGVIED